MKKIFKYMFMIQHGYRYIHIFKQTFFNPFINQDLAYKQLSLDRQAYSNTILKHLNIKIKVIGKIPKKDKILYAINHRSLLDIIVMEHIFSLHNKTGTWIAKQELFDAFYGKFFKYSGCISVDLENKRGLLKFFKTIKKTMSRVNDFNIYIFPEGERHKGDGITQFQSGASKIAISNKLKVVPVYINDKLESVFKNTPYEDTKTIEVNFGNIIDSKNLEKEYNNFLTGIRDE